METPTPSDGQPLRFACQQCGECCRAWTIPVEVPHIKEHFHGVDWIEQLSADRKADGTGRLFPPLGRTGKCHLNTSVGATLDCVFLDDNALCTIHSRLGEDQKPATCLQFPFHFVRGPSGVEVFLDPACKAVSLGGGPEVSGEELAQIASDSVVEDLPRDLELRPGVPLSWDDYSALRQRVADILSGEGSVAQRALAAFHAVRGSADPGLASLRPDPLGKRLTLTLLLLIYRNAWERKAHAGERGLRAAWRSLARLGLAFKLLLGVGRVPIEARGITVSADAVDDVPWDPEDPALRPLLDRWLAGFSHRHELAPVATRGAGLLIANLLLLSWFARAVALGRGAEEPRVTAADLVDGIQLCEKYGGSRMLGQVIDEGMLGQGLRSILEGDALPRYVLASWR